LQRRVEETLDRDDLCVAGKSLVVLVYSGKIRWSGIFIFRTFQLRLLILERAVMIIQATEIHRPE